ncbi:MAG: alpha-ketoacid dehydrogenase subunit beta [Anaerolineae bacterium]|nr:alpha-ketoacid dehydrogenase subunit beta [Anaerolineae bacterium]
MASKNLPMREALRQALLEEMQRDERVFIMGEEVGHWQGTHRVTRGFVEEFGEKRVRDTPITEMAIGGLAVGAAMAGLRPVAEFMTINFAFLALDAIINHAAKVHYFFDGLVKCPVVFRAATGWGDQATASHSHTPEPIFAHFPGLYVGSPSNSTDAYGMLKASIRNDNPVLFTESIGLYSRPGPMPDDTDFLVPIGKGDIKREGSDVTLISYGRGVRWCLQAARQLEQEGVSAEIVDVRWLRPLDTDLIFESFKKTNRAVIVEESHQFYSFGSEVAAQIQEHCFDWMDAPIKRVTQHDVPVPFSKALEQLTYPNADDVVAAVKEIL